MAGEKGPTALSPLHSSRCLVSAGPRALPEPLPTTGEAPEWGPEPAGPRDDCQGAEETPERGPAQDGPQGPGCQSLGLSRAAHPAAAPPGAPLCPPKPQLRGPAPARRRDARPLTGTWDARSQQRRCPPHPRLNPVGEGRAPLRTWRWQRRGPGPAPRTHRCRRHPRSRSRARAPRLLRSSRHAPRPAAVAPAFPVRRSDVIGKRRRSLTRLASPRQRSSRPRPPVGGAGRPGRSPPPHGWSAAARAGA